MVGKSLAQQSAAQLSDMDAREGRSRQEADECDFFICITLISSRSVVISDTSRCYLSYHGLKSGSASHQAATARMPCYGFDWCLWRPAIGGHWYCVAE